MTDADGCRPKYVLGHSEPLRCLSVGGETHSDLCVKIFPPAQPTKIWGGDLKGFAEAQHFVKGRRSWTTNDGEWDHCFTVNPMVILATFRNLTG